MDVGMFNYKVGVFHYKVHLPEPIPTGMPTGCFIVSPELLIDDFRTPKPAKKHVFDHLDPCVLLLSFIILVK